MIKNAKRLLLCLPVFLSAFSVQALESGTPASYASAPFEKKVQTLNVATPAPMPPMAASAPSQPSAPKQASGDEFVIVGGDVLQVTVWKEDGMDREIVVLPDGTITFPLIGTLPAQGLTPLQLQNNIKLKLATLIPDAAVTVSVKAPTGHTVSVLGQVAKPGEFVMTHRLSVMQGLSEAGGLTPYASERSIIILRYVDGKKISIPFPYHQVSDGEHLEKDIDLQPGDVVFVPTAGLL